MRKNSNSLNALKAAPVKGLGMSEKDRLGKLGKCDTPPWVCEPEDSNSQDFLQDCLAWHLYTTRPWHEVMQYLKGPGKKLAADFPRRLLHCKAWQQLHTMPRHAIELNLRNMPDKREAETFKKALNDVMQILKANATKEQRQHV